MAGRERQEEKSAGKKRGGIIESGATDDVSQEEKESQSVSTVMKHTTKKCGVHHATSGFIVSCCSCSLGPGR